ncbi:MAG: ATP-binding cassette domain-containing protein [Gammaproteobacteria bacterium]
MSLVASQKPSLAIEGIAKRYGDVLAVDDVSIEIEQGQVFGLLGPNAAGKTTVIRMLCGIINRDKGNIFINGKRIADARHNIGYVSQQFGQYEELTVWENLKFYAQMYGVSDQKHLNQLLERYGLTPFKQRKAGALSGGYQRRLGLVCAVAHNPDVLFLDEPTAGIDPVTRKHLWDEFYDLSAQGKTLFITTHYMEEAQRCDRLAFIDHGRIIARGTPVTIKQSLGHVLVYVAQLAFHPEVQRVLQANPKVLLVNQFGAQIRIVVQDQTSRSELEQAITEITQAPVSLTPGEPNLEDVFIALTQNGVRQS